MDFVFVLSAAVEAEPRILGMDMRIVQEAFFQVLNVGGLAAILAFLLYRPIRKVLQKRTERIQGQLTQAEEELEKATQLKQKYEKLMESAELEREEILAQARKAAADSSRRLIDDAKKEADTIRERAAHNVEMEWERAENDMRTAIIDVSAVMAEKFVSLAINKETHDRLFDETMSDLEGMTWRD
ncbi:MAG: F0F1 ATP synthase subunit B [Oscillospiraceae bacterium]|nr:F0F1 ATP synthase subunit B [Oscillospiraceae bacterium]MCL2279615.1 F0F1 ATP synthase subunit B [Oscillospiraceae bacterium]